MKKRVNLLSPGDTDTKVKRIMNGIKTRGISLLIILIVILVAEGGVYFYLSRSIDSTKKTLNVMNSFIESNNNFDRKVKYLLFKYNLIKEYLKDDADSYTYYNLFRDTISTTPASIESFEIDNTRTAKLTLGFNTYEDLSSFVAFIESESFLDKFEYVILQEFTLTENQPQDEVVEQDNEITINLECKFKEIYGV